MSSDRRAIGIRNFLAKILAPHLLAVALLCACSDDKHTSTSEFESGTFEMEGEHEGEGLPIEAEAQKENPAQAISLSIDFDRGRINVMLEEVDDSADVRNVAEEWHDSDSSDRVVTGMHLYSGVPVLTDAELTAIVETFDLKDKEVQRYIPKEMVIESGANLCLRIVSDADGQSLSGFSNTMHGLWMTWIRVFGTNELRIKVSESDAMSLYGLCLSYPEIRME